jgi:hypothetical protein
MIEITNANTQGLYDLNGSTKNGYLYISKDMYFKLNGATLELWVNSVLRQSWTST